MYLHEFLADPELVEAGFLEAVVWEPDHSRSRLLELEARYGLDTVEVYEEYRRAEQFPGGHGRGILAFIEEADLAEWIHYYEIFRAGGGDPWELHGDPEPRWPEGEGSLPCGGATAAFLLGSEFPAASPTPAPPATVMAVDRGRVAPPRAEAHARFRCGIWRPAVDFILAGGVDLDSPRLLGPAEIDCRETPSTSGRAAARPCI